MQVSGVLIKIKVATGTSAKGAWTAYSLGVDVGQDDLKWFQYGFKAPAVTEGSFITFEAEENPKRPGYYRVVGTDIKVDKERNSTLVATKAAAAVDNRQNSIVRQNASGTAARIVSDMITHGVIKLPAKGKAFDAYLEYHRDVTNRLFLQNIQPPTQEELSAEYGEPNEVKVVEDDEEDFWGDEK